MRKLFHFLDGLNPGPRRLVAGLVLAAGIGLFLATRPAATPPPPAAPILALAPNEAGKVGDLVLTEEAMQLAEVRSALPQVRLVEEKLKVSGSVRTGGNQLAKVTPAAAGKVLELRAQVGDRVRAGQLLATIESSELAQHQAEYRQALARTQAWRDNLGRQRELARLGQFGRPQVEEARNRSLDSERDVHSAEHHLKEERASLQQAEAELQVATTRWRRAESLSEVVSGQDRERMRADYEKARAARAGAASRVAGAEGDLALARKRLGIAAHALGREEKVYAGQHLTSRELVEAESALRLAEVDLESAAERVRLLGGEPGSGSRLALRAPIAGTVQECAVTLGETVTPDRLAFSVINLANVWAELAVAPKELPKLQVGDTVELTAESAPGKTFRGRVESVGAASDERTRAIYVRARLANPQGALKAGTFVSGVLITEVRQQRLTVPETALQEHTGRPTLYVALQGQPGAFEVRHVVLGARGDHWREVAQGLKPGEPLAVSGTFYLKSEALKSSLSDGCCGGD